MPESFTAAFAQRLNRHLQQPVKEINRALVLEAGTVYVCKGDRDCIVTLRDGKLAAMPTPNDSHFHGIPASPNWLPAPYALVEKITYCASC